VLAQPVPAQVTQDQLAAAEASVSAALPEDDPSRETLLKLYSETRSALEKFSSFSASLEEFSRAQTSAREQALTIQDEVARRQASPRELDTGEIRALSLADTEQKIKLNKSELDALKSRRADIRAEVDAMPGRIKIVLDRLTELGTVRAELDSQMALMNEKPEAGGEEQARLWRAQAEQAGYTAEKASLDAELLSEPMRLQLLKAQLDKLSLDIAEAEKRLQALEGWAGELRQDEVNQAQAQAALVEEGTRGKHELVQALAAENAALTEQFTGRSAEIEKVRQRESILSKSSEQLESDLKSIKRKLEVLGMTTAIGQILREQSVQLPGRNEVRREMAGISDRIRQSSLSQIELEEERRNLRDREAYVQQHLLGQSASLAEQLRDDLMDLSANRWELVAQAVELESTYAGALGDLEFTLRRHRGAVQQYRDFIAERLLWIPSRAPFSLFLGSGMLEELRQTFAPEKWQEVLKPLPSELKEQPLTVVCFLIVLLLAYFSPRLKNILAQSGHKVGHVRDDRFMDTIYALGVCVLLSFKWPLLLLILAWLFEMQPDDTGLANALYIALGRTAFYFWVFELQRMLLLPGGLAEVHFRWPASRTAGLYNRVLRLEQSFLPSALLVILFINLYPREVGGALGALGVIVVLFSIAYFFHRLPSFVQGKVDTILTSTPSERTALWGRIVRWLLVFVPLAAIGGVLLGYAYTANEFALLLVRTILVTTAMLLVHELGLRWLRITRRRMTLKVRQELAHSMEEDGELNPDEEMMENDPALLSDEGTKFLNAVVMIGGIAGLVLIWAEVFPALGIFESFVLWHQSGVIDGREAIVPVTLADLAYALLILLVGWVAVRRIPSLLELLLRQRMHVSAASAYAATRIFSYGLITMLVVAVMGTLGGSWSQIQWAVAALSVGIGFGLQEIVANFISGLIILFEQPIRVGDVVTVGEVSGTVTKIRMRATTIRDWDRRELLVPNKEFITGRLLNWSLSDAVTRCSVQVGVAYGTDMKKALGLVRQVCAEHPEILDDPKPLITFDEFGDNSLLITVRFYLGDLDNRLSTASAVRLAINDYFNEKGIVVAFPQRDVHLDASEPVPVRMVSALPEGESSPD
jgi:potassium efflux system protein